MSTLEQMLEKAIELTDEDSRMVAELRRQIAGLSRPHAEVLMLFYFEGLSRSEIAAVVDVSESVVKSRLHEARQELRERVEKR